MLDFLIRVLILDLKLFIVLYDSCCLSKTCKRTFFFINFVRSFRAKRKRLYLSISCGIYLIAVDILNIGKNAALSIKFDG